MTGFVFAGLLVELYDLVNETEKLAVCSSTGMVPMDVLNEKQGTDWPDRLDAIIKEGRLEQLNEWYRSGGRGEVEGLKDITLAEDSFRYAPLYRTPPKIWGIGLNYAAHAHDPRNPHTE